MIDIVGELKVCLATSYEHAIMFQRIGPSKTKARVRIAQRFGTCLHQVCIITNENQHFTPVVREDASCLVLAK